MRVLIFSALVLVLSGCVNGFQSALESRDVERLEKGLLYDGYNASSPSSKEAYHARRSAAIGVLSEVYLEEFLQDESSHISLSEWDSYCWNRLPVSGARCSEETRQKVAAIERDQLNKVAAHRQKEIDRMRAELISGRREISSLHDAEIVFQPAQGDQLLFSPHVDGGDGKYYRFSTYITAKRGEHYISWWPDAGIHYQAGAVILKPTAMYGDIRFGSPTGVVGKYVGNRTIRLANGGQAVVPVFAEAYVSGGK